MVEHSSNDSASSDESLRYGEKSHGRTDGGHESHILFEPVKAGPGHPIDLDPAERENLTRIATAMSTQVKSSDLARTDTLAGLVWDSSPDLDPTSKTFDLYKWIRMFMNSLDEEGIKLKRAGILWRNLSVSGSGAAIQLQSTVDSSLLSPFIGIFRMFVKHSEHKQILHKFNGCLARGEMLIVLGRPGSGCSTFLKTICGETNGLTVEPESVIHYSGIPQDRMVKHFKGEVVYNQEVDKHFPHLTVGQTLEFAASARTPNQRIRGISRKEYAERIARVIMAVFGLSHTFNTRVGNDFVRGVSGGERKRVSIAEMALATAPIAAWDNATRGLDSASAFKFVDSLRKFANISGSAHAVAIYQASQDIYDAFDKVVVLYSGREVYFGPANKARAYFENMGWYCTPRQTTGDFLTSVTNPSERKPRQGFESKVPRTPAEFESFWQQSADYQACLEAVEAHEQLAPLNGDLVHEFEAAKHNAQAKHSRKQSPYLISIPMQINLCTKRAYQRIWSDRISTITKVVTEVILALAIGSMFYNNQNATVGFFGKGATLFFAILLNAIVAISEINALYSQRPIVEKHKSYAFYHPACEAIAGILSDVPIKFLLAAAFNIVLYFLSNLRREPSQFFIFFIVLFLCLFIMSAIFRTLGAVTYTVAQAMSLASLFVISLLTYTGFVLPVQTMHDYFKWIHWINPLYYAMEILVANEFHGRNFTCSAIIPAYTPLQGDSWICNQQGAVAGQDYVNGDAYIRVAFGYKYDHVWRNFGIMIAWLIFLMSLYFLCSELNSSTDSVAEVLVFRRGHVPASMKKKGATVDQEAFVEEAEKEGETEKGAAIIPPQRDIFTWQDVVYDIKIKGEPRRLLDHVCGYVKPGTLTALMGVSGAGKTTLLDVLAQRTTMGVITGDMLVNGAPQDSSFQRKTGYVQQQDLHLATATVRESLQFSAMLRQPKTSSRAEKYDYVEKVIEMLGMEDFAEAVVGSPGQGLNVEQRKLLTIGVELAAKPKLLLFLDEPTSGLDSQSAWSICAFLRKLADSGQAVLCTIHQPSAVLFQQFDRLLFLAKGGKTVYFGPIGQNSRGLLDYFESHGSRRCGDDENPAEFMLEIVNQGSSGVGPDWHEVWKNSEKPAEILADIAQLHQDNAHLQHSAEDDADPLAFAEFAMPMTTQYYEVTRRIFQQYWRMPGYIMSKFALGVVSSLFIGFSFYHQHNTHQGVQNVIFSTFMLSTVFSSLVQQITPLFVSQRALYEVRERPSKSYSWKAFMCANIVVELPYNIFLGILAWACYNYPLMGVQSAINQGTSLLFLIQFFMYAGTFATMIIAALPDTETAAAVLTLIFATALVFNGVMRAPAALPGFWIFMYRVSPFTYWIGGLAATFLHGETVKCADNEHLYFDPPTGQTCGAYMADFLASSDALGYLSNYDATTDCSYCPYRTADQITGASAIYYNDHWRNWGIFWAYILFNVFLAVSLYWAFRVKHFGLHNVTAPFQRKKVT